MVGNSEIIAALNDKFRRTFSGGRIVMTDGVQSLPEQVQQAIFNAVQQFNRFDPKEDDVYGEHDFGKIEHAGTDFFWKIDYLDSNMAHASPNAADTAVTTRVLTIMLAEEY
jgi:hypothetical protein